MDEASNLSTFDLYTDLIEDHVQQKEYSFDELEVKYKSVKEDLNVTKAELTDATEKSNILQIENVNLKKNFSSLLITAKAELKRKCEEIQRLRCCLESRNRRLNRSKNTRRSFDQLSRSQGVDDSQTGDTFDRTARVKSSVHDRVKSSVHDLGFSKYRLGKEEQKDDRRGTKSNNTKTVKSSKPSIKDRLSIKVADTASESKNTQKDLGNSKRVSFQTKDIAEFVSSARQNSSKDYNSPNKTVTESLERKHSPKTKDHRHRDRKIDVSRGRLDGKLVKRQQRHDNIHREKNSGEKECLRNISREKENVASSNSKGESRKRRHGSESLPSSKRRKSAMSPIASNKEKDSTLHKYLHTSPITSSTPKTQGTSKDNSETKDKTVKCINNQERVRSEICTAKRTSSMKSKNDVDVRAVSVASKLDDLSDLKHCAVQENIKDQLSMPDNSTTNTKLKEPSSLYDICKSRVTVSECSDIDKNIINSDKSSAYSTKSEPVVLVTKEECNVPFTEEYNVPVTKESIVPNLSKTVDAKPVSLTEPKTERDNNMNKLSSEIAPVTLIEEFKAIKEYCVNALTKTEISVNVASSAALHPDQSKSSISVVSSTNIKRSELDSDSCLSIMSSVVDSSSCSSVGVSFPPRTQRQNSTCTVTSTTLWECDNGITTWVQSEELVNGVKKFRLRPSSSKGSVTTCSSSRQSLLSSPEVSPTKAVLVSVESDSNLSSLIKNNKETINKPMLTEFLSLSPFKTPINATSMDRIIASNDCFQSKSIDSLSEKDLACSLITIHIADSEISLHKQPEIVEPMETQKCNIDDAITIDNTKEKDKKSSSMTTKVVKSKGKISPPRLSLCKNKTGPKKVQKSHITNEKSAYNKKGRDKKSSSVTKKEVKTERKLCPRRYSTSKSPDRRSSRRNSRERRPRQSSRKINSLPSPKPNSSRKSLEEASESLMSIPDDVYVFIGEESPRVSLNDDNAINFDDIGSKPDQTVLDVSVGCNVDTDTPTPDTAVVDKTEEKHFSDVGEQMSSENVSVDNQKDIKKADDSETIPGKDIPSSNILSENVSYGAENNSPCKVVSKVDDEVKCIASNIVDEEESMEEGEITSDSDDDLTPNAKKTTPDAQNPEPKLVSPPSPEHLPTNDLRLKLKSRQPTEKTIATKRRPSENQDQRRRSPVLFEVRPTHNHHPSANYQRQDSPRDKEKRRRHSPVERVRCRSGSSDHSARSHQSNESCKDSSRKTCSRLVSSSVRHRNVKLRSPNRSSDRRRCASPPRYADNQRNSPGRKVNERRPQSPKRRASPLRRNSATRRQRSPLSSNIEVGHTKSTSNRDRTKVCDRRDSPSHSASSHRSPSEDNSECSCCKHSNQRSSKTPSEGQLSPDINHLKRVSRSSSSEQYKTKSGRSDCRNSPSHVKGESSSHNPEPPAKRTLTVPGEKDYAGSLKSDSRRDLKKRKD